MPTPTLEIYNGRYYAIWSEDRRSKRKSMGTAERAVAEVRFGQWLAVGGHKAQIAPETVGFLTIADLWKIYDEKHVQTKAAAPATIEFCWKNLQPHFGAMTVADIEQSTIDDYEEKRIEGDIGRPSKSATVRKELVALRACLNWHASPDRGRRRLLETKDLPAYRLPDEAQPRDRWLTTAEVKAVFEAARALHPNAPRMTRGERFLWLALETGARKQAILDLTWDRVDFETNMINYAVPGRKQTKKRRPAVPISDVLRTVLLKMHAERGTNKLVMDHGGEVWSAIQAIVVKAGLAPKHPRGTGERIRSTGISPHTFRHTAATHMARRGVPLYDIAGVLGNTLAMVEKVYSHHCPGRLRAAVNSITSGFLEAAE